MNKYLLLIVNLFFAVGILCAQPKNPLDTLLTPDHLQRDFALFQQAVQKAHASPYRFHSPKEFERLFEEVEEKNQESRSVGSFYNDLALITRHIRDGHTQVFPPESYYEFLRKEAPLLPLYLTVLDSSLYVKHNWSAEPNIYRGMKVTSVNGVAADTLLATFEKYGRSYDGYIPTAFPHYVPRFFDGELGRLYGFTQEYQVELVDTLGERQRYTINAISRVQRDSVIKVLQHQETKPLVYLDFLADSTVAYLRIKSFEHGLLKKQEGINLKKFLQSTFEQLHHQQTSHLIIDVRGNGGGTEGFANLLYSYLSRKNFQALAYVRTHAHRVVLDNGVDAPIKVKPFQNGGPLEKWLMQRKGEDGQFYRKDLNWGLYLKAYNKSPEHVYDGDVYILMNGGSYSTTNYFIRLMYKAQRAVFIGEEPGGQYQDGTTQAWLDAYLPHSGIEVVFPLFEEKFNDNTTKIPYGRGVPPDHEVPTTLGDFIEGTDSQLEYTLNVVIKENSPN